MKWAAVLGWDPRQLDQCALWEVVAAIEGYQEANATEEKPEPPTPEEHDALMLKYG